MKKRISKLNKISIGIAATGIFIGASNGAIFAFKSNSEHSANILKKISNDNTKSRMGNEKEFVQPPNITPNSPEAKKFLTFVRSNLATELAPRKWQIKMDKSDTSGTNHFEIGVNDLGGLEELYINEPSKTVNTNWSNDFSSNIMTGGFSSGYELSQFYYGLFSNVDDNPIEEIYTTGFERLPVTRNRAFTYNGSNDLNLPGVLISESEIILNTISIDYASNSTTNPGITAIYDNGGTQSYDSTTAGITIDNDKKFARFSLWYSLDKPVDEGGKMKCYFPSATTTANFVLDNIPASQKEKTVDEFLSDPKNYEGIIKMHSTNALPATFYGSNISVEKDSSNGMIKFILKPGPGAFVTTDEFSNPVQSSVNNFKEQILILDGFRKSTPTTITKNGDYSKYCKDNNILTPADVASIIDGTDLVKKQQLINAFAVANNAPPGAVISASHNNTSDALRGTINLSFTIDKFFDDAGNLNEAESSPTVIEYQLLAASQQTEIKSPILLTNSTKAAHEYTVDELKVLIGKPENFINLPTGSQVTAVEIKNIDNRLNKLILDVTVDKAQDSAGVIGLNPFTFRDVVINGTKTVSTNTSIESKFNSFVPNITPQALVDKLKLPETLASEFVEITGGKTADTTVLIKNAELVPDKLGLVKATFALQNYYVNDANLTYSTAESPQIEIIFSAIPAQPTSLINTVETNGIAASNGLENYMAKDLIASANTDQTMKDALNTFISAQFDNIFENYHTNPKPTEFNITVSDPSKENTITVSFELPGATLIDGTTGNLAVSFEINNLIAPTDTTTIKNGLIISDLNIPTVTANNYSIDASSIDAMKTAIINDINTNPNKYFNFPPTLAGTETHINPAFESLFTYTATSIQIATEFLSKDENPLNPNIYKKGNITITGFNPNNTTWVPTISVAGSPLESLLVSDLSIPENKTKLIDFITTKFENKANDGIFTNVPTKFKDDTIAALSSVTFQQDSTDSTNTTANVTINLKFPKEETSYPENKPITIKFTNFTPPGVETIGKIIPTTQIANQNWEIRNWKDRYAQDIGNLDVEKSLIDLTAAINNVDYLEVFFTNPVDKNKITPGTPVIKPGSLSISVGEIEDGAYNKVIANGEFLSRPANPNSMVTAENYKPMTLVFTGFKTMATIGNTTIDIKNNPSLAPLIGTLAQDSKDSDLLKTFISDPTNLNLILNNTFSKTSISFGVSSIVEDVPGLLRVKLNVTLAVGQGGAIIPTNNNDYYVYFSGFKVPVDDTSIKTNPINMGKNSLFVLDTTDNNILEFIQNNISSIFNNVPTYTNISELNISFTRSNTNQSETQISIKISMNANVSGEVIPHTFPEDIILNGFRPIDMSAIDKIESDIIGAIFEASKNSDTPLTQEQIKDIIQVVVDSNIGSMDIPNTLKNPKPTINVDSSKITVDEDGNVSIQAGAIVVDAGTAPNKVVITNQKPIDFNYNNPTNPDSISVGKTSPWMIGLLSGIVGGLLLILLILLIILFFKKKRENKEE